MARHLEILKQTREDLLARGAGDTHMYALDLLKLEQYTAMLDTCKQAFGQIDLVLIVHGTLLEKSLCEQDASVALQQFTNNALTVIAFLKRLANYMEQKRSSIIAEISSAAGDRGWASNNLHGAVKAAVRAFCEGLRVRMFKAGMLC